MTEPIRTQVAVVGAGFSGLAAAQALVDDGIDTVVLEARNRVGGRTLNVSLPDGSPVEMGGQWIGPGQDLIADLANQLGIDTYATYDTGQKLFDFRGRVTRYRGNVPLAGPISLADLGQALVRLHAMARTINPDAPWTAARAAEWDRQTFSVWMHRNTKTAYARNGLTAWSHAVMAADPDEVSLLHVLVHSSAHRGPLALMSTRGGAQERRIVGGSQGLAQAMAHKLGDRVMLNQPVRQLTHLADRGASSDVLITTDSLTIEADRVIVAASPAMAGRINYSPPLPGGRDLLTQRMGMGSICKVVAVYPRPFWREEKLSGQSVSDRGLISCTFDNTPAGSELGVLVGFVAGRNAVRFAELPDNERKQSCVTELAALFGARAAVPIDYHEKIWMEDEWARGGYFGIMAPGGWVSAGANLREPVGPIHWAGSETAGLTYGSMDGAIRAGRRAASEAAETLRVLEAVR